MINIFKKIDKKNTIIIIGAIGFFLIIAMQISSYIETTQEKKEVEKKIDELKTINEGLKKKLESLSKKEVGRADASYYIKSIYGLSILENIKTEIKSNEPKFRETIELEIKHQAFTEPEKHENFIYALSKLGYICNVKKESLTLIGSVFTEDEARKIIIDKEGEL